MLTIDNIRDGIKAMILRRGLATVVWDVASIYNAEYHQIAARGQDFDEICIWHDYLTYWADIREEIGNACDAIAVDCDVETAGKYYDDYKLIKRTILARTARQKVDQFKTSKVNN